MAKSPRDGRAAKSGGQVLREVTDRLAKGAWAPGLTLLTGDDLFHLDRAQHALLDALVPRAEQDYALSVYGDQDVDLSVVVAAARSLGMFAPVRVVLVRELGALKGECEPLVDYATRPPERSHLIVRAPKLDRRRKLDALLVARANVLAFGPPADPEPQIRALAKEKGLELDPEAASLLAAVTGFDFYRADSELEKLRCWLGRAGRVGPRDLGAVLSGSGVLNTWNVADAVYDGDRRGALGALRRLLDSGFEPLMLVGGLAFRARAMLQAKAEIESGAEARGALGRARLFGRPENEILRALARHRMSDLLAFPAALLEADRALKGSSLPAGPILERLVERLTPQTEARRA